MNLPAVNKRIMHAKLVQLDRAIYPTARIQLTLCGRSPIPTLVRQLALWFDCRGGLRLQHEIKPFLIKR